MCKSDEEVTLTKGDHLEETAWALEVASKSDRPRLEVEHLAGANKGIHITA